MIPDGAQALWDATRASGLVSLVLLTLVMVLGVQQVHAWAPGETPRFVTAIVHRNVSLLAVAFLAAHIVTAVLDGFAPISWTATVVPFASPYRTLWLGLGTVAFDLIIALVVTSLLRQRLGYRSWKLIHWIAYACWPIAIVHGLGTGSDGTAAWVLAINLLCVATVVGTVVWRLGRAEHLDRTARVAVGTLTGVLALVLALWTVRGPAQAGWARKAGTPDELLAAGAPDGSGSPGTPGTTAAPGATTPKVGVQPPFTADLDGTLTQTGAGSATTVTVDATVSTSPPSVLHVEIRGSADREGGIQMRSSAVTLGPSASPRQWEGTISSLQGSTLVADLAAAGGDRMTLTVRLQIDRRGTTVGGSASAVAAAAGPSTPTTTTRTATTAGR